MPETRKRRKTPVVAVSQSVTQPAGNRRQEPRVTYSVDDDSCENRRSYSGTVLGIIFGAGVGWVVAL